MVTSRAALLFLFLSTLSAQQVLTIAQAVQLASERYPEVRVSEAGVRSAAAAIGLARTAYLPEISLIAGVNRATRNNVLGLLLPSQILAPISGPVIAGNSTGNAWGSTAGVLFTWEPFDFGLRQANVAVTQAARIRAEAGVARTRLEVAILTADCVLTLLAAEQTVLAAEAALARTAELLRITDALVRADLRPGAESSFARAEQAAARAQLVRGQQAVAESKATLSAMLGVDTGAISISSAKLLSFPSTAAANNEMGKNPVMREQQAVIEEARARLQVLDRTYVPRFSLQATTYARGTGALSDGGLLGGANGLGPTTHNWAVGFTANFPILDFFSLRERRGVETGRFEAEQGRYDRIRIDLKAKQGVALASLEGATAMAETLPAMTEAARVAVEQARARYQAGLSSALEVADVQRRLAQAEIDAGLARLGIWRARFALSAAEGDLTALLAEASQ